MKLLILVGSARKDSLNLKLGLRVSKTVQKIDPDIGIHLSSILDFEVPLYNGDQETDEKPEGAQRLKDVLNTVSGLVLVSPEYNSSIPGVLKNLIDWVSRFRPMPWKGGRIFLASASPSGFGGARGLMQLRVPLDACGAFVYPQSFSLPAAHEAFNDAGEFAHLSYQERLESSLTHFIEFVGEGIKESKNR